MYAYLDDHQRTNAVEWANKAAKLISENNDTVVVGGTALYIETLLRGAPPVPVTPPDVKQYVSSLNDDALKNLVFRSTADFRFQDRHRMERAAGVFLATGRPITEWQQLPRTKYNIGSYTMVYTQPPTKPALHQRILIMLKMGALDEVREVRNTDKISVKPIGLDPATMCVSGKISHDRMVALWADAMYQYSRRQYRFFNKLRKALATKDSG
jgi:tRNA A37 N6-isopentenylltransferase MiaA